MSKNTSAAKKKSSKGVQKKTTSVAEKRRFDNALDAALLKLVDKDFGKHLCWSLCVYSS